MKNILQKVSGRVKSIVIRELYGRRKSIHDNFIRTEGVSYPRSGHSALYNILKVYFGSDFIYCGGLGKNCGCGSVPCSNPNLLFSKNHDFNIYGGEGSKIIPEQQYIVQYRNPVRSIISDFHLFLAANPNANAEKDWFPFAHAKMNYWINFVDKWVMAVSTKNKLFLPISYEKLITSPVQTITEVIHFLTHQEPDKVQLRRALEWTNLKPRNRYADFQFYDKDLFLELESMAGDRLNKLHIPSFEDSV